MRTITPLFLCVLSLVACSNKYLEPFDYLNRSSDIPSGPVENALKRAVQISQIEWTPLEDIPNNANYYYKGDAIKGMPYSSVKELDKFIGIDVSFRTFMTAVHNPRSVLYTENISKDPYRGTNCASFYGVVCSSVVNYALGIPVNYVTASIDTLSIFTKVDRQEPEAIEICDVLWSPGHEVMIYDISRSPVDSLISKVSILESAGTRTRIHSYSLNEFIQRWKDVGWVLYRYNRLDQDIPYEPNPFIPLEGDHVEPYRYNDVICPSRGDYAVYREGEAVIINILDKTYVNLTLLRDNEIVAQRIVTRPDEVFNDLPYGSYSIIASDTKGNKSDSIHFEIVDTDVRIEKVKDTVQVCFFSHLGKPLYIKLCSKGGAAYVIKELSKEEILAGSVVVSIANLKSKDIYCKVFFTTDSGRVTNIPIKIQ